MASIGNGIQITGRQGSLQTARWGDTILPIGRLRHLDVFGNTVRTVADYGMGCWEKSSFLDFYCGSAEKAKHAFWTFLKETPVSFVFIPKSMEKSPPIELPGGRTVIHLKCGCYDAEHAEFFHDFVVPYFFQDVSSEREGSVVALKFEGSSAEETMQKIRTLFRGLEQRTGCKFVEYYIDPRPAPAAAAPDAAGAPAPAPAAAAPAPAPAAAAPAPGPERPGYVCGAKCHQSPVYVVTDSTITLGQGQSLIQTPLKEPGEADWVLLKQESSKAAENLGDRIAKYPKLEGHWGPVLGMLSAEPERTAIGFEVRSNLAASVPDSDALTFSEEQFLRTQSSSI